MTAFCSLWLSVYDLLVKQNFSCGMKIIRRDTGADGWELGSSFTLSMAARQSLGQLACSSAELLPPSACAVLLGEGRDVKLADAGLSTFMKHDYMAAKSNLGPFIYTVR